MKKTILLMLGFLLLIIGVATLLRNDPTQEIALFPDLSGPSQRTQLPRANPNLVISDFTANGSNALALLVNDSESSWFGLVSGLRRIGVPLKIVTSVEQAISHDVIIVYPSLTGSNTSPEALRLLAGHVRNGGTLLAFSVIGGGMPDLFGFSDSVETAELEEIRFAQSDFNRDFADSPAESVINLGGVSDVTTGLSGTRYLQTKHPPIASFRDGSAAISYNFFATQNGTGHAYALGLDLGHFILRANNGRFNNLADTYVNTYQPKVDTFLRFIRKVYLQGEQNAVLLSPAPEGKDLSVLVTHDIDFTASINNVLAYADYEQSAGISATYFIQTKYVTDYNDSYFFTPESAPILNSLVDAGMEIASHSVAHSNEFKDMRFGNGREQYPDYRPFVQSFNEVRNASILGELRVSKFLLEHTIGQTVQSFRPGHLSLPQSLPQMLEATAYKFSSSITANQALTHLPYQAMVDRSYNQVADIYEFPVTIEDEAGNFVQRLDQSIALAKQIAQYRGLVNLLVHTETVGEKLNFIRLFTQEFRDTAWFGTMSEFGYWWQARNKVSYTVESAGEGSDNQKLIRLNAPEEIQGLTLELPTGWQYQDGISGSTQTENLLVLGNFSGEVAVRLTSL